MNTSSTQFTKAYLNQLHTVAAEVLHNTKTGGLLTLPIREGNEYRNCTIPFYLKDNFSFSLGNNWSPLVDVSSLQEFASMINSFLALKNSGTQMALQSKAMSTVVWNGSESPTFDINTVFVCVSREYNPVEIIKVLSATCLPIDKTEVLQPNKGIDEGQKVAGNVVEGGIGMVETAFGGDKTLSSAIGSAIRTFGMYAPLEYGINHIDGEFKPKPNTTLAIRIGDWFEADNLVVDKISNVFSKEVIAPRYVNNTNGPNDTYKANSMLTNNGYGFPIYCECTLTLRPASLITSQEFMKYFIIPKADNETPNNSKGNITIEARGK